MFNTGNCVFVTGGLLRGSSGVVLNGSTWHARVHGKNLSDRLYSVHIDGVSGPSSKIWGIDLVPYSQRENHHA